MLQLKCANPECVETFHQNPKGYIKSFCSRTCANKRVHSDKTKEKISQGIRTSWENMSEKERKNRSKNRRSPVNVFEKQWEELSYGAKRERVILEQKCRCNKCDRAKWLGLIITFELDHVDGNRQNNSRKNLEALCPNCHSQTITWRGRNNSVSVRNARILKKKELFGLDKRE